MTWQPGFADDEVLRRRHALAADVRDELSAAGLPVAAESSTLGAGVLVEVDPLDDESGGGVVVSWKTHFMLRSAAMDALMDPVVEVMVVDLRRLHPRSGPDRLRYGLARDGVDPVPSRAAIGPATTRGSAWPRGTGRAGHLPAGVRTPTVRGLPRTTTAPISHDSSSFHVSTSPRGDQETT